MSSSGTVSITPLKPITAPLVTGDTLTIGMGGLAVLKVSDGTELILGSTTNTSTLNMMDLSTKDDTGLLTHVRLLLSSGEVTAKAPKLRTVGTDRSDLEIESG